MVDSYQFKMKTHIMFIGNSSVENWSSEIQKIYRRFNNTQFVLMLGFGIFRLLSVALCYVRKNREL